MKVYGYSYDQPVLGDRIQILGFRSEEERDEALIEWICRQVDPETARSAVKTEHTLH